MNVSNVRQIKLKIIFFSKVLPSKWNPAASWTYKNKEMNVSQRSLIANPSKIGTALLIKFGVKFADFVLKHKLQKRIFHRRHINYK